MLKQALFAFGTDPHIEKLPTQPLPTFLAFVAAKGHQHQNHRVWSFGTHNSMLNHINKHLTMVPGVIDALWLLFSRNERRRSTFLHMLIIWEKWDIPPAKSIWSRNRIINMKAVGVSYVYAFFMTYTLCHNRTALTTLFISWGTART